MSLSSRPYAWIALVAATALAGCSGSVHQESNEGPGDGLGSPGDPSQPPEINGVNDPPDILSCGDGTCDVGESCATCSADCGACPGCGDGTCDAGESCSSCSQDCGACASCAHPTCSVGPPLDDTCDACVTQICAVDSYCCDYQWDGICVSEVGSICGTPCASSCGDGLCGAGESCSSCSQDCGACAVCGDGWCDYTESCSSCAADCGACPACGDGQCDPGEDCSSCAGDCGVCPACPGNALSSSTPQTVTGSTAGLVNGLTPACGFSNAPEATYSFTATAASTYEFNTFGSGYDTLLAVLDGTCAGASLACNDDTVGFQSKVSVPLAAGQTVVVVVDGFASSQGAFTLNVCDGPCAPSCGDGLCDASESCSSCATDCGACPVCGDGWCNGTESCSSCTQDCGACPVCGDGWCDFTESCSSCAADCGACPFCGNGQCDPGENCSSCAGDCGTCPTCPGNDLGSTAPQTVTGTTVGLLNGLTPACAYSNAPEATYSFTAPAAGSYEFNTIGSGYDTILDVLDGTCAGASLACNDDSAGLRSRVTVSLAAGQTIVVAVDGFGSSQGAYTLNVCNGPCPASCGDGLCSASESCSSCAADCGACPVCGDGWCDPTGESCSSCAADCGACPVCGNSVCDPGEDCSTCAADCGGVCPACPGTDLGSTVPQTVTGTTVGLLDALTPSCGASNAPEATYSFTAPATGSYQFNTFGSGYDTVVQVRDGTCAGASLACNDDTAGLQSQVIVSLTAGQTVIVVVDGFSVSQGAYTLNVL